VAKFLINHDTELITVVKFDNTGTLRGKCLCVKERVSDYSGSE
jgi:hypothetical protein